MRFYERKEQESKRRALRTDMTEAEKVLWGYLRRKQLRGRTFRRQHSIGSYIVDFYCHSESLVVEVDGDIHYNEDRMAYDKRRTTFLNAKGLRVIRFNNQEVFMRPSKVIEKIESAFRNSLNNDEK